MKYLDISKLPDRPYILMGCAVVFWSITTFLIFIEILHWPYIGAQFNANIAGKSAIVTKITVSSPADLAGLKVGDEIIAVENNNDGRYRFTGLEAIGGRHQIHSYDMSNATTLSKNLIWNYLSQGKFVLILKNQNRITIKPANSRPVSTLPFKIFNTVMQSLIVFAISMGIYIFAKPTVAVRLLIASGLGLAVNNLIGIALFAREFVKPAYIQAPIFTISALATLTFIYGLLALLWYFPSPINRFPFGKIVIGFALFVWSAQLFQFYQFPIHPYQFPYLLSLPIAVVISAIQWYRTRNRPMERASVKWFMLTIYGVSSVAAALYSIPIILRQEPIIGPVTASFVLSLIFVGIALGTLRFRLFDMQRIWWRVIVWFVGGLMVVAVDLLLISQFDLDQKASIPLALLITGWAYFPIRQRIFEYFVGTSVIEVGDHVPNMITRFSTIVEEQEFDGGFVAFLQEVFTAKDIGAIGRSKIEQSRLEDHGLALRVPDISGSGSIQLIGKAGGRQLFTRNDCQVAESFLHLVRNMNTASKQQFTKLQEDRQRIVRDLHDDVGGRLLSLVYQSKDEQISQKARDALAALKESLIVVEDSEAIDFEVAWHKIKTQAKERFEQSGHKFQINESIHSPRILSAREYVNVKRISQEIVSNAIKYNSRGKIELSVIVDDLGTIKMTSTNWIFNDIQDKTSTKRGLLNIDTRLGEIGGKLHTRIETTDNGKRRYVVKIVVPLLN